MGGLLWIYSGNHLYTRSSLHICANSGLSLDDVFHHGFPSSLIVA